MSIIDVKEEEKTEPEKVFRPNLKKWRIDFLHFELVDVNGLFLLIPRNLHRDDKITHDIIMKLVQTRSFKRYFFLYQENDNIELKIEEIKLDKE